jgi:hypothetical protein
MVLVRSRTLLVVQKTSAILGFRADAADSPNDLERALQHVSDKFVKWTSEPGPANVLICYVGTNWDHRSCDRLQITPTLYSSSTQSGNALGVLSSSSMCSETRLR